MIPVKAGAVGDARSATLGLGRLGRQQRGDERPQFVADKWFAHAASVPSHDQVLKGALSSKLIDLAARRAERETKRQSRVGIRCGTPDVQLNHS